MEENLSFEQAFERLEKILELMNTGKLSLEESLKLFEEAEVLLRTCSTRLNAAEAKIEQIVKGRDQTITTEPFARK